MPTDPAYESLLREQPWARIRDEVLLFAYNRCRSKELAADLTHEAMRRVFDPGDAGAYRWDPAKEPSFARFLKSVVNGLRRNEIASARARRDVPLEADGGEPREIADESAFSEERAEFDDLYARRMKLLRARLERANDTRALAYLDRMLDGAETPGPIADAIGCSLNEALAARRRLLRASAAVAREVPDPDREEATLADGDATEEEVA